MGVGTGLPPLLTAALAVSDARGHEAFHASPPFNISLHAFLLLYQL